MPFQPPTGAFAWPGVELHSAAEPCHGERVSGDGVFVETGRADGGLMLLLVDVMGHGAPAASTVASLQNVYLPHPVCLNRSPAGLLAALDGLLQAEWARNGRFVAGLAILVHPQSWQLEAANAALPMPVLGRPNAAWQAWSLPTGSPLGLPLLNPTYQSATTTLPSGHHLLAFTDGVTEAGQSKARQFQYGPFQRFLAGLPAALTPQQVVARLMQALQTHVGAGWPEDDTTIVDLRRP